MQGFDDMHAIIKNISSIQQEKVVTLHYKCLDEKHHITHQQENSVSSKRRILQSPMPNEHPA